MTLETVSPAFGVSLPELLPWTLSVCRPSYFKKSSSAIGGYGMERKKEVTLAGRYSESSASDEADEDGASEGLGVAFRRAMRKRSFHVSSKGDINATFAVPGLISIPSDGVAHNVTICELELDADMSWVSVPKKSPKAHLVVCIIPLISAAMNPSLTKI